MTIKHWLTAVSGSFSDGTKWTGGTAPTASDDVVIDAIGTYTVTSTATASVLSLSTIGTATFAITGSGLRYCDQRHGIRFQRGHDFGRRQQHDRYRRRYP